MMQRPWRTVNATASAINSGTGRVIDARSLYRRAITREQEPIGAAPSAAHLIECRHGMRARRRRQQQDAEHGAQRPRA